MTSSTTFLCSRCKSPVPVPDAAMRDPSLGVVCPSCGQRYTRRVAAAPAAAGAGQTQRTPETAIPQEPAFAPETLVAGRWRIRRFLARGGMGDVYEAEDTQLDERVALKTIHPSIAAEPGAVDRFKRETHLARRVTHANVCRIFDVGFHEAGPGAAQVVFLTMELLEGETLTARLRRTGRMAPAEVLPLARQMAAALAAAHAAGVVHRDFKGDNVFLVPRRSGGERVVVTDFGIARPAPEERSGRTLTTGGSIVGTPAYMAPEQVTGDPAGPAADQYALAVVLFEMLTGELPFRGDSPLSVAARRLTDPPLSARSLVAGLDESWDAALQRALARAPGDRFATVLDLVAALEPDAPPTVETQAPITAPAPLAAAAARPATNRRQRALAAALLVALAAASAWAWWRVRALREARALDRRPVAARPAVAVLPPRNLSGRDDSAWLATALAEMLSTELAEGGELRVVSGDAVARTSADLALAPRELPGRADVARLRAALGADYLVLGAYTALGDSGPVRVDLRLEDAASGETLASLAESGGEAQLFDVVGRLGAALRQRLGARAESTGRARPPTSPGGARAYAEGLDALRRFDPQAARNALERAVAADPGNALARSALASAYAALGHQERAEEEAKRAYELSGELPEEERRVVEARYFETARQWSRAAELWQSLWTAWPDSLEYGLRVATCRTAAGDAPTALAAVERLRALPSPEGEDPRIDLAEAAAAAATGDSRRQAEAAGRAAERSAAAGARLLEAEARVAEAWALRNLGQAAPARAASERAAQLYAAVGDRAGVAAARTAGAAVLLDGGDLAGASAAYESALETYRAVGDRGGEARSLNNLAVVLRRRGDLDAARARYQQVAAIESETGDRVGAAYAATNLAAVLADLGDLAGAAASLENALATWRDLGDQADAATALGSLGGVRRRSGDLAGAESALAESLALRRSGGQRVGEVASLNGLGAVALDRGDLDAARRRFDEALALARELAAPSGEASALQGQGDVAALAGERAAARARFEEALAERRRIGERAAAARSALALARLAADDDPDAAARSAREVLDDRELAHQPELEALARLVLARVELARGRAAAVGEVLAPARALALPLAVALEVELTAARARSDPAERAAALAELEGVARRASAAGLPVVELEARLAAAELTGDAPARAAVAARARAAGLAELAARAGGSR